MTPEEHREFLEELSDERLMQHLRAYARNGMDWQAHQAAEERDERRSA